MPDKVGRLSGKEKVFVQAMTRSNDVTYAAEKAGYASPATNGPRVLARPDIQKAVSEAQLHLIRTDGLTAATKWVVGSFTDPSVPAGAKVQCAKLVFDTALGAHDDGDGAGKPLSAMSRSELQAASTQAMAVLARLDAETLEPEPSGGVFD